MLRRAPMRCRYHFKDMIARAARTRFDARYLICSARCDAYALMRQQMRDEVLIARCAAYAVFCLSLYGHADDLCCARLFSDLRDSARFRRRDAMRACLPCRLLFADYSL